MKRLDATQTRWAIGFVCAFMAAGSFVGMIGFVGAMENGGLSILHGTIGGIAALLLWVVFFYISSLMLHDFEPKERNEKYVFTDRREKP